MAFVQWLWVLISHAVFTKRTCTWMYTLVHTMHSYVNGPTCSLYTFSKHCAHTQMHTYSTLSLLHKWNLVRRHSCTIHLHTYTHTPWQTLNLSNDGTHTPHTHMYLACKICSAEPVHCTCTCILFHWTGHMHVWEATHSILNFCTVTGHFVLVVPSLFIHDVDNFSHACGAPLWLVLCTYHATWDSQQLSLRRNATVLFIHSRRCLCLARSAFVLDTCSEFHLLFLTTRCRCSVTVLST